MQRLWDFATALYARPGIEQLCLDLQDDAGVDICLLLAVAWAGCRGRRLDSPAQAVLATSIEPWQSEVTNRVRGLRRHIGALSLPGEGGALNAVRKALLQVELDAEHSTLRQLEQQLDIADDTADTPCSAVALANIATCVASAGIDTAHRERVQRQFAVALDGIHL